MTALLDAAARIGRDLGDSAHWDRSKTRCNWMGRAIAEIDRSTGQITPTSIALGLDLYGGSAGIALFLAELSGQTGDPLARSTARGALAQSVHRLTNGPGANAAPPLSFFDGHLGVAYVAHRVAALTGDPDADRAADALLGLAAASLAAPRPLDVLGGNAGAIPPLLALGRGRAPELCRDLAIALGDEILRAAVLRGAAWAWDPAAASGPGSEATFPAGFTHGAAGFGLALMELFAATGCADFHDAAHGAFAWSDSHFDPSDDHRPGPRSGAPRLRPPAWCYGASGIALARLRAATLDPVGRDGHLASARRALDATLTAIDTLANAQRPDASLCHGLAGALEALLAAGETFGAGYVVPPDNSRGVSGAIPMPPHPNPLPGGEGTRKDPRAEQGDGPYTVARRALARTLLIDRHGRAGDWPSGLPSGGPNPSLLLGTAGVGHAFLRQHDPNGVPPVLIIRPGPDVGGPSAG